MVEEGGEVEAEGMGEMVDGEEGGEGETAAVVGEAGEGVAILVLGPIS